MIALAIALLTKGIQAEAWDVHTLGVFFLVCLPANRCLSGVARLKPCFIVAWSGGEAGSARAGRKVDPKWLVSRSEKTFLESASVRAHFIEGPRPIYMVQVRQAERLGSKGGNAPNLHMRT